MPSFWFGDCEKGVCIPASDDLAVLVGRVKGLAGATDVLLPDWEIAVRCGFVKDRADYLHKIHETAIAYSIDILSEGESDDPSGLIQMVRMLDQIDEVVNLLMERVAEWYLAIHPGFSLKYARSTNIPMIETLRRDAPGPMLNILDEIQSLSDQRRKLTREVMNCAERILPNSSALVGGLVAARLAAEAGGIHDLAKLPASSLQVLGARKALFSHLTTGCSPPKHGIIFQHARVHGSKRERRGRVARALSAKLAIASKIDFFRKELDPCFIEAAHDAIRKAGRSP
jgi:nucleolar protein 56